MNRQQRRSPEFRKAFAAHQAGQPSVLTSVAESNWPKTFLGSVPAVEVWRSRKFLVVIYLERGTYRMTVNRAEIDKAGRWGAEITWEELMECKRQIGRGEQWAVECFPADKDVVNVANMRHLWLLDEAPEYYGWVK